MIFLKSFGAPEQFLDTLVASCDLVLPIWAEQVARAYGEIKGGDFNFSERWERAFMAARPVETTRGGYYVNWSMGLKYNSGAKEMKLELNPPYADYSFRFEFSTNGVRVRVNVKPGSLSGESYFPQMADIYKIFGGWENLS